MNTNKIGDLCELIVLTKLIEEGNNIALPYGNQHNWDILVENGGVWDKLQVKSAHTKSSGSIEVDCIKSGDTRGNKSRSRQYTEGAFDYLVAVYLPTKSIWKMPFSIIYGRRSMVLTDDFKW